MPHPEITPEQTASVDELLDWYLAEDPARYILKEASYILKVAENLTAIPEEIREGLLKESTETSQRIEKIHDFIQRILPILDRAVGETSSLKSHLEEPLFQDQISSINEKLNLHADDNTASIGLNFLAYCLSWKGIENGEDRYKPFLYNLNKKIRDIIESKVIADQLVENVSTASGIELTNLSEDTTTDSPTTVTSKLLDKVRLLIDEPKTDKDRMNALKQFFLALAEKNPADAKVFLDNEIAKAITDYRVYPLIPRLCATNTRTQLERYRGDQTQQTGHSISPR